MANLARDPMHGGHTMPTKKPLSFEGVRRVLKTLFEDLHAERVLSSAGATPG